MEKENKKTIEIPFGAKDSELYKFEYTIPDGYEAEIKDGKVIVKKKESEDERTRKFIKEELEFSLVSLDPTIAQEQGKEREKKLKGAIAWLEKQKEQKPLEWSAYDKATIEYIIEDIKELRDEETDEEVIETYDRELNLLQCINDSVKLCNYTNPAEWSEEDKKMVERIVETIQDYALETGQIDAKTGGTKEPLISYINFLWSIRPFWKPSAEQMKEYGYWYKNFIESGLASPSSKAVTILGELLEQLKKL